LVWHLICIVKRQAKIKGGVIFMPDLIYEQKGPLCYLTLNRPESRNAFSCEMLTLWREGLLKAQADPEIRVIVVTGRGKSFSAGGDVKSMANGEGFLSGYFPGVQEPALAVKKSLGEVVHGVARALQQVDKPVIAAVNGAAAGAGMDMALMCDLRIAAEEAIFAESYVKLGLVPGDGGAYLLPRLVGVPKALELLWTGKALTALEAKDLGLVNRVVPQESFQREVEEFARELAQGPPLAMAMIKRAVYQGLTSDFLSSLDYISSQMSLAVQTRDHKEGLDAFLTKRRPIFEGH